LTQINRELIETLKQQNEELTKKISKQKIKSSRSTAKSTPKNGKQLESIRKELSNAYKQIDMYKETIQNLKSKEVSLDNVDKYIYGHLEYTICKIR
jgi:seryl-tRNA synthetase